MDSKKTQKIVVVILVFTALLGIVGAGLVYFLSTQDRADIRDTQTEDYCACITAYTTPTCNDCKCTQIETQALESTIGKIVDGVCSLDCETTFPEEEEGESPETINCLIPKVRPDSCHSVSVKDLNTRELIVPPIFTDRPILITATFVPTEFHGQEEEFSKFTFVINGISTDLDAQDVPTTTLDGQKVYLPELEFSNFQNIDTLTIQAIAYSNKEPDGTSPGRYCYKQYDLQQERGAFCSNLLVYTQEGHRENTLVVNQLELKTPNLLQDNEIFIEFDFDHPSLQTVTTRIIPEDLLREILVRETIFLEYDHLYSLPNLYTNESGFPVFDVADLNVDSVEISAQLYVNNMEVDSALCKQNIALVMREEPEDIEDIERPEDRDIDEDEDEDMDEQDEIVPRPDILLTMEGPSCVTKAQDETSISRTSYRLTITNNSENPEEIMSIRNKLPLGFKYLEDTTTINRVLVSDEILELTLVGESQELIWTHGWTIQPNEALTLEYAVNVTSGALEGENQNEAVVEPANVPEDMSRLRAEFVTLVSDECEHEEDLPDTGNLTILSLAVGLLVLAFGIFIHQGKIDIINKAIYNLINTKPVKKALMPTTEYFEDSILEKEKKEDEEEIED